MKQKQLCILGSTGSIGTQALDVVAANPEELRVRVLAAHQSVSLMADQIHRFHPDFAVLLLFNFSFFLVLYRYFTFLHAFVEYWVYTFSPSIVTKPLTL